MKHILIFVWALWVIQTNYAQDALAFARVPHYVHAEKAAHAQVAHPFQAEQVYDYDATYYRLELQIDPNVRFVKGKVTMYFIPSVDLNVIKMDGTSALNVLSAQYHGQNITFSNAANDQRMFIVTTAIPAGTLDSLTITYEGTPSNSGFGSFVKDTHNGTPIIWTLSEPYGAKDWWFSKNTLNDKADSIDVYIETPAGQRAASNGILVEEKTLPSGKKLYHWSHNYPITSYLVAFAVTNYVVYSDYLVTGNDSLEILNYVYPEDLAAAKAGTAAVAEIIDFYETKFAPYPFRNEKYGHAQFSWGGGEEHQTMSFVTDFGFELLAHELAHQWFGDKVTCGSFADIFLNEGFATYCAAISDEFLHTTNDFDAWKANTIDYVSSQSGGSVFCTDTIDNNRIFSWRLTYQKGALLLHMLRYKMGDDAFFEAIHNYINDPQLSYKYARIGDLQAHLEAVSGENLTEFFADWYYGQGHPVYDIRWKTASNGDVVVQLNQTPSHSSVSFFEMPVPIQFIGASKDTIVYIQHILSGQTEQIAVGFPVTSVKMDPENWILKKATVVADNTLEIKKKNKLKATLVPNPTTDKVKLVSNKSIDNVYVFDMQGKVVKQMAPNREEVEIDFSDLPNGNYKVLAKAESRIFNGTVVKE